MSWLSGRARKGQQAPGSGGEEVIEIQADSPVSIISFGGCDEGFGWHSRLERLGLRTLCFKDSRRRWYLDGADGFSPETMLDRARAFIDERPVILLGQSAGGYVALRYADALGANALAFAPQTHQFWTYVDGAVQLTAPADMPDIRGDIIYRRRTTRLKVIISASESDHADWAWGDRIHVGGLDQGENVHVERVPFHSHTVALCMAGADVLDGAITGFVAEVLSGQAE